MRLSGLAAAGLCGLFCATASAWDLKSALGAAPPSGPVLVGGSAGAGGVNNGTYETRSDGTLVWPSHYFGISAAMDWSPYDFVELTLENTGAKAVAFSFEVKDAGSSDYWTRVNLEQILGPGLQTIRLPTRLRVGEAGRPGRPLDSAKVVSLILARDDEKDRTPVLIRRIELKKAVKTAAPGILAFHAGPEDAGVPDGFEALTEKTDYTPRRKWGWLEHRFWAPYPQVNRVPAPDRLTASNLTIASAKLRVDLKPGAYRVWMIIDHPGGFWGEYPYYHRRTVSAQGKLVLDEKMTPGSARADYFRWQDAEDREDGDLFELYWSKILKEKTFDVTVTDGRLDLDFKNEGCPDNLPCFGLALSALVVYPANTEEERTRGARWLEKLRDARHAEFLSQHQLKEKSLTRLLTSFPPGLRAWDVSADLDLSRAGAADVRTFPESNGTKPRVSVFRNARAFFAPVVSWKGAGPENVDWRVEGVPQDVAVSGGWIKYRALRDSYSGNVYSVRERWSTEEKRRTFAREDLGRLWLRFAAPGSAKPGLYPATLVVTGSGRALRIPFELRVYRAQAANLDFPVGPFYNNVAENWWDESDLRPRLERLGKLSLVKMRALGMTAFSFGPEMRIAGDGTGISLKTPVIDRVMKEARELGFVGLVGYGDVFRGENLCGPAASGSPLSGTASFRQAAASLEARAQEHRWLPLALIVCDEPVGAAVGAAATRLANLPKIDGRALVQWSVTTSLGPDTAEGARTLVHQVSLPFISIFSQGEIRFPWAFYNDSSRKTVGLEMFRLRRTTDLRYRLLWVWNQNMGNPFFDFDGRENDAAWCSSTSDERLRCTIELDRVIDRGLTDYRAALGLRRLLDERKDLAPARRMEGEALLREAETDGTDPDAWLSKAAEYQENL